MKKVFLAAIAALMSISLSAQIYVGGTFSLNTNNNENKLANTSVKTSNIRFAPMAGYYLNEDLSVGARLTLRTANSSVTNTKTFGFGLQPFARYTLLTVGQFKFLAEGGLNFSSVSDKTINTGVGYTKDTDTTFGIYAEPVVTYALTEKINLEAALNVARLAFNSTASKTINHIDNPAGDTTMADDAVSTFSLGANSTDIVGGGIGGLTIGFTYSF